MDKYKPYQICIWAGPIAEVPWVNGQVIAFTAKEVVELSAKCDVMIGRLKKPVKGKSKELEIPILYLDNPGRRFSTR